MLKRNNIIFINDLKVISTLFEKNKKYLKKVGNTLELNNVLLTFQEVKKIKNEVTTQTDKEERNWLYEHIDFVIQKLRKDINTRQAIIYNLHNSGLDHNCLNSFHFYYREEKLHLNVYVRSMNYDDNFNYDLYTFNLLLNKACNELVLNKGQINVFIMSLHRLKKRQLSLF